LPQLRLTAKQRLDYAFIGEGMTLLDLFDADTSDRDIPRRKPDLLTFLTAAAELASLRAAVSS